VTTAIDFSLVELPKDRKELARRQRVVQSVMVPALHKLTEDIRVMMEHSIRDGLKRIWKTGKLLKMASDNQETYGPDALVHVVFVIGRWKRNFLEQAAHFYKDFDPEELKELLEMRTKYARDLITWSHVQRLLPVDDKKARRKLLQQTCENDWTPEELAEAIDRLRGKKVGDRHKGGRPVLVPPHLAGKLANFEKVAGIVVRNAKIMYSDPEVGFLRSINTIAADRITPELIEKIDREIEVATKVRDVAIEVLGQLQESRQIAERRSAEHAAKNSASTAEAVDAEFSEKATPKAIGHKAGKDQGNGHAKSRGAQKPVGVG